MIANPNLKPMMPHTASVGKWQGADPQGTDLRGTGLQGSKPQGTDLRGTGLQGSKLQGSKLQGSKLQGSEPQGTDPQGVGRNLQGSKPQGTDPQGVGRNLQGSKLQGSHPYTVRPGVKTLGVTGGIGSGKSYVSRIFASLGIPCYDSDTHAKDLYQTDKELVARMIDLFGPRVWVNGELNKPAVAQRLFSQPELLAQVNALVHPRVWAHFVAWTHQFNAPYVLFESAVLLEINPPLPLTRTLTVSAPYALRLERAVGRGPHTAQEVQNRMKKQWTDAQREALAHFVLESNNQEALLPRVLAVHEQMLAINE